MPSGISPLQYLTRSFLLLLLLLLPSDRAPPAISRIHGGAAGLDAAADRRRRNLVGRGRRVRARRLAQGEHQPQVPPQERPPPWRIAARLREPQADRGAHHRPLRQARRRREEEPPQPSAPPAAPAGDVPEEGQDGRRRAGGQAGRSGARVSPGVLHREGPLRAGAGSPPQPSPPSAAGDGGDDEQRRRRGRGRGRVLSWVRRVHGAPPKPVAEERRGQRRRLVPASSAAEGGEAGDRRAGARPAGSGTGAGRGDAVRVGEAGGGLGGGRG